MIEKLRQEIIGVKEELLKEKSQNNTARSDLKETADYIRALEQDKKDLVNQLK